MSNTVGTLLISDSNGLFSKNAVINNNPASSNSDGLKQIDAIGSLSELISNYNGRFLIQLVKSKALKVYDIVNGVYVFEELLPGLLIASFSPQSNFIHTWQAGKSTTTTENNLKNDPFNNLKIFKLTHSNDNNTNNVEVELVGQFPLSYRYSQLYWSSDEQLVMYIEKESLLFIENNNFTENPKVCELNSSLCSASLSPANNLVVVHTHDKKRNVQLIRMFRYPNIQINAAIASTVIPVNTKNVEFKWNPTGTSVIVIAEVDSPGKSYYDERKLFYLSMKGDSVNLNLKPDSHSGTYAIHDIAWTPNGLNFAVIHGSLPAETYLFDLKCNIIFKFPKATRNILYFNPYGNVLCTTAHGNAHGDVEMWNMETFKMISRFPVKTKTKCVWLPDGKHMVFAVTSPTLRVNNGYEIWNFMAEKVNSYIYESPAEMYDLFPVKSYFVEFQKPILPVLTNPIDLVSSRAPQVYVPKASRKYLEDDLNNMGFMKKQVKSLYYGKDTVNKVNLQKNPFYNHNKNDTARPTATAATANSNGVDQETERTTEFKARLKVLNKKVNDIQKLKLKIQNTGYTPNSDQLMKIENEPYLLDEKTRLEQLLGPKYPIEVWNAYDRIMENIPLTSNSAEHIEIVQMFMNRGDYDRGVNTFSPEGRLIQVEYALEAIKLGATVIGIKCVDGVVLAVEKRTASPLVIPSSAKKIFEIDHHMGCAMSGLVADGNTMVDHARVEAQNYWFTYNEPAPIEGVVQSLSRLALSFGNFGKRQKMMSRPFGVAMLIAVYDEEGPKLYHLDPSGTYLQYEAKAIGAASSGAQSALTEQYKDDLTVEKATELTLEIFKDVMEDKLTINNCEIGIIKKDENVRVLDNETLQNLINDIRTRG